MDPEEQADEITGSIMSDDSPEEEEDLPTLEIRFPDEEMKSEFISWFEHAGGEQDFFQYLQVSDVNLDDKDFLFKLPWE